MKKRWLWSFFCLLLWCVSLRAQDADVGYQEALRRIEEARVSRAIELDLSKLSLKFLPPEIGQLGSLQKLNLYKNELTSLPPEIGQLTNLQTLNLSHNELTMVSPQVSDLAHLQILNLSFNQLTILPTAIRQLTSLTILLLLGNQLTILPPEIGELKNLQWLDLSGNPLTTLPIEIGHLAELTRLDFTPVTFPPLEMQGHGTPAILAYLRDYETMQMQQKRQTIAAGVGGVAGLMLAFRWRQRRGLSEKKKRL